MTEPVSHLRPQRRLVLWSLGSNEDRVASIRFGLDALAQAFGEIQVSPVYQVPAFGFDGEDFYNLAVAVHTDWSVQQLNRWRKQVEDDAGRRRDRPRFSDRTLDIDLLTWGDFCGKLDGAELPSDEIERFAWVLGPLADLLPDARHPRLGLSYRSLWQAFKGERALTPVVFPWP